MNSTAPIKKEGINNPKNNCEVYQCGKKIPTTTIIAKITKTHCKVGTGALVFLRSDPGLSRIPHF